MSNLLRQPPTMVYELPNSQGDHDIRFEGALVAFASATTHDASVTPASWTTVNVYLTTAQNYVVHYHRANRDEDADTIEDITSYSVLPPPPAEGYYHDNPMEWLRRQFRSAFAFLPNGMVMRLNSMLGIRPVKEIP